MVKKTLLSLAIAASAAGLTACNTSSTSGNNDVETNPVTSGLPGATPAATAPVFSVANSQVPTNIDLLFAEASATDGTASITDTSPPVTTMINDLAGFSGTATIDIPFNGALSEASIAAGSSVWLIELKSKEDNTLIDSLDLTTIVAAEAANPFSDLGDQLVPGVDYVAEYVEQDNGATPTIRVHPLKPLDPKTKYLVVVTDQLKDADGETVQPSAEYKHIRGTDDLVSAALAPVRTAIQGWEQLAGGFLATVTEGSLTQSNVILSYAITTNANTDVLMSMSAPENYIDGLLRDTVGLESLIGEDAVTALVQGTAAALNAANAANDAWTDLDPTTDAGVLTIRNRQEYKDAVSSQVAKSIIASGAAQSAGTTLAGGGAGAAAVMGLISAWNADSANANNQIPADPTTWTSANYDAIALATGAYTTSTSVSDLILTAKNGAGALLKAAANRPQPRAFGLLGLTGIGNPVDYIPHSANPSLPNPLARTYQGAITLPQFMKDKDATDAASFTDFWKSTDADGNSAVGAVIDAAFGNAAGTTPPKDGDGTGNVTYRFPFAQHVEDVQVPVLVTTPAGSGDGCTKPAGGWPTVIFQHGITTDRTASLPFASVVAAAPTCMATVAIDMPTHGLDASTTDRNGTATRYSAFNSFNVGSYADTTTPANTPYSTLLGVSNTGFENLKERHGNVALDATQQPVAMNFAVDAESGNSGDFFINLTNMQQTRDHLRQAVTDLLNLNASIGSIDVDGGGADLDENNLFFAGHSLGAIVGMTYVAVNNAIANDATIADKDLSPIKAAVFANPGGQLPKLLENSPSFSARILPGLAAAGLTQGMSDLETFYATFQAPLDTVDPVNFTGLLAATNTPVLIQEMVGGGLVDATDSNEATTGLPDTLIAAGGYPADTVVPNNANPALNAVASGKSYLAGTDPLVNLLDLTQVNASVAPGASPLKLVTRFKEGTHGTFSSADAATVFGEMVGQAASFFATSGVGLTVGDADQLQEAAE